MSSEAVARRRRPSQKVGEAVGEAVRRTELALADVREAQGWGGDLLIEIESDDGSEKLLVWSERPQWEPTVRERFAFSLARVGIGR